MTVIVVVVVLVIAERRWEGSNGGHEERERKSTKIVNAWIESKQRSKQANSNDPPLLCEARNNAKKTLEAVSLRVKINEEGFFDFFYALHRDERCGEYLATYTPCI